MLVLFILYKFYILIHTIQWRCLTMKKNSLNDATLSTPAVKESLGETTSAGLTSDFGPGYDGLAGNTPLLPNYSNPKKHKEINSR